MIKDIDDYLEGLEVRPKFILNINELRNLKNQCEECIKNISKYKEEELLKIYYLNGLIYRSLEKGEEAINCFEKVAVIAKTINDEIWQARAYSSISLVYSKKNDIHNSKKYFDKAFNLIKFKYTLEETGLRFTSTVCSDEDTIFCPTNHAYFNLSGEETILNHMLQIDSEEFVAIDQNGLAQDETYSI